LLRGCPMWPTRRLLMDMLKHWRSYLNKLQL
jgi:hypothetical protein